MCDQTEILYLDGEVVWVKLGPTWWPGEVLGPHRVPPEALLALRKPPIAVVKFFREESLELVKNINSIYKYNCSRKGEFIKKGLDQYRSKHGHMELFPEYVREAEERTHGDPHLLEAPEYRPPQKVDYAGLFGSPKGKAPASPVKRRLKTPADERTPKITHPRIIQKYLKGTSDYRAHILVQEGGGARTPGSGHYTCHACPFSCTRINVMVLHNRCHSEGYVAYSPPKRARLKARRTPRARPRPRAPRRSPEAPPEPRSEMEIKSSLLADWSEDSDDSVDILSALKLADARSASDSASEDADAPDVDCDKRSRENDSVLDEGPDLMSSERKTGSCFDFEDEEDLPIESIGRKIPRLSAKSDEPSRKLIDIPPDSSEAQQPAMSPSKTSRAEEENLCNNLVADLSLDMEINNLLQETIVPSLPALPLEIKGVGGSTPDKDPSDVVSEKDKVLTKSIFKTKTFFRSRHTRSQDAIEKYVTDNTSMDKPPTYMEPSPLPVSANELPLEVKVPKFAPKIQLKKMKAAMGEREKSIALPLPREELCRLPTTETEHIASDTAEPEGVPALPVPVELDSFLPSTVPPASELGTVNDFASAEKPGKALDKTIEPPTIERAVLTEKTEKVSSDLSPLETKTPKANTISKSSESVDACDKWNNDSVDDLLKTSFEEEKHSPKTCTVNDILGTIEDNDSIADNLQSAPENAAMESSSWNCVSNSVEAEEARVAEGPTESDLQIAETLINLPTVGAPATDAYCETKTLESDQNFNAAKSLVQMSEAFCPTDASKSEPQEEIIPLAQPSKSKLFQILDEPLKQKPIIKMVENKSAIKVNHPSSATAVHKPRVIIRRSAGPLNPKTSVAPAAGKRLQEEEALFDINSMPIVLSEEILTPDSLGRASVVVPEATGSSQRPKVKVITAVVKESLDTKTDKSKLLVRNNSDKPTPTIRKYGQEPKLGNALMKPIMEKTVSPNILSKSPKIRATKHMLVVDKTTGEQKIISTKADDLPSPIKSAKNQLPVLSQQTKGEKFIILPPGGGGGGTRMQKIIVNPQTGKSQVIVEEQRKLKPGTAKIVQNRPGADAAAGNTVMILTNSQGGQSKIVLTPEHQRILFPKKAAAPPAAAPRPRAPAPPPARAGVSGNALITSTGQLLPPNARPAPSGRPPQTVLASRGQLVSPQPAPPRLARAPPLARALAEPGGLLHGKKPGTVMHLTAAQFEVLQRTGQIITQRPALARISAKGAAAAPQPQKLILQKYPPNNKQVAQITPRPQERKVETAVGIKRKSLPSPLPPQPTPPPPKKHKLRDLLTVKADPAAKKYPSPVSRTPVAEQKAADSGRPDEAVAAAASAGRPAGAAAPAPETAGGDMQLLAVPGESFGGPPDSFYLCFDDKGTLRPVDHQPLMLENNQLVPMLSDQIVVDQQTLLSLLGGEGQQLVLQGDMRQLLAALAPQPSPSQDILAAALADAGDSLLMEMDSLGPDFPGLGAGVSETSAAAKPIMSALEQPPAARRREAGARLEDSLMAIGVSAAVPTSLELPITVTDPRIAPKLGDPLAQPFPAEDSTHTTASLLTRVSQTSLPPRAAFIPPRPASSMPCLDDSSSDGFVADSQPLPEVVQTKTYSPISMPLLTEDPPEGALAPESDAVQVKSMPILLEPAVEEPYDNSGGELPAIESAASESDVCKVDSDPADDSLVASQKNVTLASADIVTLNSSQNVVLSTTQNEASSSTEREALSSLENDVLNPTNRPLVDINVCGNVEHVADALEYPHAADEEPASASEYVTEAVDDESVRVALADCSATGPAEGEGGRCLEVDGAISLEMECHSLQSQDEEEVKENGAGEELEVAPSSVGSEAMGSPPLLLQPGDEFCESSSDSAEIPLQPAISVSQQRLASFACDSPPASPKRFKFHDER